MKKNLILGSVIVASLVQYSSPAFADKEAIGNIIGGVIGGVIGSKIGKGNGNTAAIIIGTIAGTLIGGKVGRDMDEADRRAFRDAQDRALRNQLGHRYDWDGRNYGSRTGSRGSFSTTREGYNAYTGEYCREYVSIIHTYNGTEETRGVACTRRDGSWHEVRETEVRFGSMGHGDSTRPPRYPDRPNRPEVPPPVRYGYERSVRVDTITRRTGGEWIRINVNNSVSVDRLQVRVVDVALKIHEAIVHTEDGRQIRVRELSPTGTFYAGETETSENLNLGRERVVAIDIRAESMGGYADALIKVTSSVQQPSLSVTRY